VLCTTLGQVQIVLKQETDALTSLRRAITLLTRLSRLHPNVPFYQHRLARGLFHQARAYESLHQNDQELASYKEALLIQDRMVRRYPGQVDFLTDLVLTLNNLAVIEARQERFERVTDLLYQAIAQQRQALKLVPDNLPVRRGLNRLYGFVADIERLRGRLAEAVGAAQERLKLWDRHPAELYQATRDLALSAGLAGRDKPSLTAAEEAEKKHYMDLAIEALRKTVACGFKDWRTLQTDPALEPLRRREEYRQIVQE
jgi:tetratricopeptide (TPR) repeat protein